MTVLSAEKNEQRNEKRTAMVCKSYVHGVTDKGELIKTHALTDNISQGGLFLQGTQLLKLGSSVFTFTRLLSGARLVAQGKVVRIEKKEYGLSGFAICFNNSRLIPAL